MEESRRKTEFLVGLFIFIGLALLGALVVQFGRLGDSFTERYPLTVIFDDAAGLIKGSEVRMGGARVGRVAATPELNEAFKVEVNLEIQDEIRVPKNSQFQVKSASLLGDKLIVVTPPSERTSAAIPAGATIFGSGSAGLDGLQRDAETVSQSVQDILADTKVTMEKINQAVEAIHQTSTELTVTIERINSGVLSEQNLQSLEGTLTNFDQASSEIEPLLTDAKSTLKKLDGAATSAQSTFDSANQRIDDLAPSLRQLPTTLQALTKVVNDAAALLNQIESGDGLIATLASDEEVSNDAKTFIRNLKEQGILRYRDTEDNEKTDPRTRFSGPRR